MDDQMKERANIFLIKIKKDIDDIKNKYPNPDDIKNIQTDNLFNEINFFDKIPDEFNKEIENLKNFSFQMPKNITFDSSYPLAKLFFSPLNKFPTNNENLLKFEFQLEKEKKILEKYSNNNGPIIQVFNQENNQSFLKKNIINIILKNENNRIIATIIENNKDTPSSYNINILGINLMNGILKEISNYFPSQQLTFEFLNSIHLSNVIKKIKDYINDENNMSEKDYENILMPNINLGIRPPCSGCGTGNSQQA